MGLFHKTLKDVQRYAKEVELDKALAVLKKHYEAHVSESFNGQLYRLQRDLGEYRENIYELMKMLQVERTQFMDAAFRYKLEETEEKLKEIKREIKKMLKLERIKLE